MQRLKKKVKNILAYLPTVICSCNEKKLINETGWIKKLSNLYFINAKILNIFPISVFLSKYSKIIVNSIESNQELYNKLKKEWIIFFEKASEKLKFFMMFLFYECDIFDGDVVNRILDFVKNSNNLEYRYWISMYISKMVFFKPNGMYSGFYNDRKAVLKKIALEIDKPHIVHKSTEKNHIVIITYLLDDNIKNSMQRVATMFAKNLKKENNKITILCLDSFYQSRKESSRLIKYISYDSSESKSEKIQKIVGSDIYVKYINENYYLDRMNKTVETLYQLSPNIIIDIADEYSPLSYYYSQDFFTVYVPMRGSATSQFHSAILGSPHRYKNANQKTENNVDLKKVIEWSFPEYVPPEQGSFTKQDIGIDNDCFCIISIGNNKYFSNVFVDEICHMLKNNDKLVWLFVGDNSPDYLHQNYSELLAERRVIEWGYENNLAGICRACDVLLRYDITGGSGATAIAAMQGLPIVMTNYMCDPLRWLGAQYSSIDNYHDLALEIQRLYCDNSYYEERKKVSLELVHKAIDSKDKWDDLYRKIYKAYERWENSNNG